MPTHCLLDIGSNSVRSLLVRVGEGIEVLDDSSHVTRLAQGFAAPAPSSSPGAERQGAAESWTLTAEAVDDTVSVVREIQRKARSLGARAMTRAFFQHDPPLAGEVEALCGRVMEVLTPHLPNVPRGVPAVGRPGRRVK